MAPTPDNGLGARLQVERAGLPRSCALTMLAPDIVEAIFEGRQPRHLNLHTLRGRQGCCRVIGQSSVDSGFLDARSVSRRPWDDGEPCASPFAF